MNKEALIAFQAKQKKIDHINQLLPLAEWLYVRDELAGAHLNYSPFHKLSEATQERYCVSAQEAWELGYHKVTEPPLLSDEERMDIIDRNCYHGIKTQTRLIAEAQRQLGIKHNREL